MSEDTSHIDVQEEFLLEKFDAASGELVEYIKATSDGEIIEIWRKEDGEN